VRPQPVRVISLEFLSLEISHLCHGGPQINGAY
jgi:hypothetical protein